jgi:hypothetical protein
LSDLFALRFGLGKGDGLRWALIVGAVIGFVAFPLLWVARRSIRNDVVG